MNRIRHAAPDGALDSVQMAAVFAQLHLGYRNRRNANGGPRSCLTPISAGILLISIAAIISQAHAQTIALPSATSTTTLQTLSPGSTTFDASAGTVINASTGDGVDGNNAQNWVFTNHGSITGVSAGVSLSLATLNGVTFDNFSSVRGNASAGVLLTNGGQLTNHAGAAIVGAQDGVSMTGTGSVVSNDGSITTGSNAYSGVHFASGGTFTQSASGTLGTNGGTGNGVVFNSGSVAGSNAGVVYGASAADAFLALGSATGVFSNSGTFSAGTGTVLAIRGLITVNNGVSIDAGGTLQIDSTGELTRPGEYNAITLEGAGSTLINNGLLLTGSTQSAVKVIAPASALTSTTNTGTIGSASMSSDANGIRRNSGAVDIVNRGAIYGGSAESAICMTAIANPRKLPAVHRMAPVLSGFVCKDATKAATAAMERSASTLICS